jgi:hypothetical protein
MADEEKVRTKEDESAKWIAWAGIAASIIAFFFAPYVMGSIGIVIGIIALFSQQARTLAWWAIGLGVVAMLVRAFIY